MNEQLVEYNKEIQPMIRDLLQQKDLLKDFIESDEEAQRFVEGVKESQAALKDYVEDSERGKELLEIIKSIEGDIKTAVKAAVRGTPYKAAEFKGYAIARAKQSVEKVTAKGELFSELEKELT